MRNRIIAIIPARGGSKGVPLKNLKQLNGRPLIAYTIKAALDSGIFDKVMVSTDDAEIAETAKACGAEVPFIRPQQLSGDDAPSDDVVLHALNYYKNLGIEFDEVCKLQPTSPLRTGRHIRDAYEKYVDAGTDFVVSVCECEHSPLWCGTIGENLLLDDFISEDAKKACRQQMPVYYRLNGAIYLGKTTNFKEAGTFLGNKCLAYIMAQEDSIDIDTILDFKMAEAIMAERRE